MSHALRIVCGRGSQLARIRDEASSSVTKKDYHWKILKVEFLGYEQWSKIWSFADGNGNGLENGGKSSEGFSDSKLVVGQVRGDLEARDPRMQEYLCQIRSIQEKFEVFDLSHIPRGGNTHADSLATLATSLA